MKNTSKKLILLVLLLLFMSTMIGVATLYWLTNPKTLIARMSAVIKDKTGYVVTTSGNVHVTFYPFLAIYIDEISIAKLNQSEPLVILKQASLTSPWQFSWGDTRPLHSIIRAQELLSHRIKATTVKMQLTAEKGALLFDQITAQFYQGTLSATMHFNKNDTPTSQWKIDFAKINLETLLHDLNGEDARLTITGFANMHFTGVANQLENQDFLHAMTGTLQFNTTAGALKGIDLNYFIDKGVTLLTHKKSDRNQTDNTQFDEFSGTIYLANAVAKSQDIKLKTNAFSARVMGDMQLANETFDISLQVTPTKEPRLMIPLLITGTVKKPTITLDTLLIQTILTKEEVEKISAKVGKELEKLPERANKILDQLFGNQDDH